jgi:cyclophilin family peptidyl-prolyl cis-trans isomerase
MDHDTKVTYAVILVLIVALGGFAYFLRSAFMEPVPAAQTETINANSKTGDTNTLPKPKNSTTTPTMSTTTTPLPEKITSATITTNKGVIEVTFASNTPLTVENFAKLAASGFYDGTRFHRVIPDFMIQGGDPLSKDVANKNRWGTGGPGYSFKDETSPDDKFVQGVLAMANSGPNTNGSQFFIVTAQAGTPWLAGKHTIFGRVTKGMDVALQIQNVQRDGADRPLQDVIVEKVEIR